MDVDQAVEILHGNVVFSGEEIKAAEEFLQEHGRPIKVYFLEENTRLWEESDDEERPLGCRSSTTKLNMECYFNYKVREAFNSQGADGDDTGSWSRNILIITDEKDNVLWNPKEELGKINANCDFYNLGNRERERRFEAEQEEKIKRIERGSF